MFTTKLATLRIVSFAAMGFAFSALAGCGPAEQEQEPVAETVQGLSAPSQLCVTAHSNKNSGTGNNIWVKAMNPAFGNYECYIPGGVPTGGTACCQAWESPWVTVAERVAVESAGFIVGFSDNNNTDGLRYSKVSATGNGVNFSIGTFTALFVQGDTCEGCIAGTFCNSCWIDSDGHGNCKKAAISSMHIAIPGSNHVMCIE